MSSATSASSAVPPAKVPSVPRTAHDDGRLDVGRPSGDNERPQFDPILDTQWLTMMVGRSAYIF